jgi:hypothetical protein
MADAIATRRSFVAKLHANLFSSAGMPLPAFAAGVSLVLSRAVSGAAAPCTTLVPGFDMLNHASLPSCAHAYDPATGTFTVATLRPHVQGEELCISYAPQLDNDRALRLYGFVMRGCTDDVAMLPPPWPSADAALGDARLALRKRTSLARPDALSVDGGCWWSVDDDAAAVPVNGAADGRALLAILRIMHADAGELPADGPLDSREPFGPRSEAAARASLASAVATALRRYPQSLEETSARLNSGVLPPRMAAALTVREGELRALHAVQHVAMS